MSLSPVRVCDQALVAADKSEPEHLARSEAQAAVARLADSLEQSGGGRLSLAQLERDLPRLGLFWTPEEWRSVREWLVNAAQERRGPAQHQDQTTGRCTCLKRGKSAEVQVVQQEAIVAFLLAPKPSLLRSEDPATAVAAALLAESPEDDDGGSAMSVNPLHPLLVEKQRADVGAATQALAEQEAAAQAGLRMGTFKTLSAHGTSASSFRKGRGNDADALEPEVRRLWRRLDTDRSGTLSRPEVAVLLRELMMLSAGSEPTKRELDGAWKAMDSDGSGQVEWKEFVKWCCFLDLLRFSYPKTSLLQWAWWLAQDPEAQKQLMLLSELSFDKLIERK